MYCIEESSDMMSGLSGAGLQTHQSSASILEPSGYLVLYSLSLTVICPVQLILNGLTMSALLVNTSLKSIPSLRNVLISITAMGMLTGFGLACFSTAGVMLTLGATKAGSVMCSSAQFIFHTGILVYSLLWVTLTVVVFIGVRWGAEKVKPTPLSVAIIAIWIVAVACGIPYITPIYGFDNSNSFCVARVTPPAYIHQAIVTVAVGLLTPFTVVVVVTVVVQAKCSTHKKTSELRDAMVYFVGSLLVVNLVTLEVNLFAILLFAFGPSARLPDLVSFQLLATNLLQSLTGMVTPLLMVATFKPVRESMKSILTCCSKQNEAESMKTSSSP